MFPSVNSFSERLRAVAQASVDSLDQAGQALHVRGQQQQQGQVDGKPSGASVGGEGLAESSSSSSHANASNNGGGGASHHGLGLGHLPNLTLFGGSGQQQGGAAATSSGAAAAPASPSSPTTTTTKSKPGASGSGSTPSNGSPRAAGPTAVGGALASRLSGLLAGSTSGGAGAGASASSQQPVRSASTSSSPLLDAKTTTSSSGAGRNGNGSGGLDRASSLQDRLRGAAVNGKKKQQQQQGVTSSSSSALGSVASVVNQDRDRRASVPSVVAPSTAAEIALTEEADSKAASEREAYEQLMASSDPGRPETIPLPLSPVISVAQRPFHLTIPAIVSSSSEPELFVSEAVDPADAQAGVPLRSTSPITQQTTQSPLQSPAAAAASATLQTTSTPTLGSGSSMFNTPRNHFPSIGIPKSPALGASSSSRPSERLPPIPPPKANDAKPSEGATTDVASRDSVEMDAESAILPAAEMDKEIREAESLVATDEPPTAEVVTEAPTDASDLTTNTPSAPSNEPPATSISSASPSDPASSELASKVERVNKLLREASPLLRAGIDDADALDGWLTMVNGKLQVSAEEIRRLSDKISLQESRLEEIRETHRLESVSSTALIQQLRDQITKSEVNLSSQASQALQIAQLKADLTTAQTRAKEEEEKRSKAIALLKTVRAKLVKTEKEKEENDRYKAEEKAERAKLVENMERQRAEREREVSNLRSSFEKEIQGLKERYEREALAKKREWELEMITTKATHAKDLAAKSKTISSLNEQLRESSDEKRRQFEQLQSRQEELESATAARESFETQMKELQYQLREATERAALAEEALAEAKQEPLRDQTLTASTPDATAAPNVSKLLSEATHKAEGKISELRDQVARLERERVETDEEHARQLRNRGLEIEKMRHLALDREREYADALKSKKASDEEIAAAAKVREALRKEIEELKESLRKMRLDTSKIADAENSAREALQQQLSQMEELKQQLEEARQEVIKQKTANRTVREEMRRLQSSIQLMERQRNPGVGYWSAANGKAGKGNESPAESAETPVQERPPAVRSPTPSEVGSSRNEEEEVNLEYLRNVILQFLENKEMRPNLVRVLSVILRFTPQELRRLNAKLTS